MLNKIQTYCYRLFFTKEKQRNFLEDLSSLVEDGVPAPQAINVIFKVSTGLVKEVAKSIMTAIAQGKRLADGMQGWFPQHIVEIIRNGEESGALATTLLTAIKTLSEQLSVWQTLITSITYPLVVLCLACGVSVFLKGFIFATFASIKPMALWPNNGIRFIMFATFIEYWWWLVIILIIAATILITIFLRTFVGPIRKYLDILPPFSLYRGTVSARFMELLGLLISSGISFKDSLITIQYNATRYLSWHIYLMQFQLSGGKENLADVLNTGLINKSDIERLKAIAQSKNFEHALIQLGSQAAKRNVHRMRQASRIFGGILLTLDAALAIFMILAVYGVGIFIGT